MRFRLQFSLRMLLLLMAVIAISLAVFRWPWKVTTVIDNETQTTTFRRAWNGLPLKHGRTWTVDNVTGRTTYEADYVEHRLLNERIYDSAGVLAEDHDHVARVHSARDQSQLAQHGFILEKYRDDAKQQLRHEWKMPDGTVLESHFGTLRDRYILTLTEWNARPFTDEMNRVLAELPAENDRLAWAAQPEGRVLMGPGALMGDNTYVPFISKRVDPVPFCTGPRTNEHPIRFDEIGMQYREGNLLRAGGGPAIVPGGPQSAFHALLICAHQRNCTLRVRFGIVTVVPIGPELLQSTDPTGALAVKFPTGSRQEKAWLEPVVHMRREIESLAERVEQFFGETGIEIDASRLNLPAEKPLYLDNSTYLRPRRDVLGTFLLVNNCRVEQQGNRLVLLPR